MKEKETNTKTSRTKSNTKLVNTAASDQAFSTALISDSSTALHSNESVSFLSFRISSIFIAFSRFKVAILNTTLFTTSVAVGEMSAWWFSKLVNTIPRWFLGKQKSPFCFMTLDLTPSYLHCRCLMKFYVIYSIYFLIYNDFANV